QGKPIKSYSLSIRISGAGVSGGVPIQIESPIILHYYVEARGGLTFDSGPTHHGLEGAGAIDQLEIDLEPVGTGTSSGPLLLITSDIPGGLMLDRTGGGIALPNQVGRQIQRVVLPNPIYGRLFRHQLFSPSAFKVWGYKARVLPIGVYIDGSQGDY